MGNKICPAPDAALLASVARDICPFPNYNPSPHFTNAFSVNSSLHLRNHYAAVQSSLEPKQLEDFTQSLRTTFGREGRVTFGGVGVVALSLAIFFDCLAKEVKGEYVPESGPILDLFLKHPRGYYSPVVYTASEYLRLVPYIANNPTRMRVETERYMNKLKSEKRAWHIQKRNQTLSKSDDINEINRIIAESVGNHLLIHFVRITNGTSDQLRGDPPMTSNDVIFNLNCVPEAASKALVAEIERSSERTKEAFEKCKPKNEPNSWVEYIAQLELKDILFLPFEPLFSGKWIDFLNQNETFDLKTNALGNWK